MKYVLQCASCKEVLGTREGCPYDGTPDLITHTICPQCNTALEQKMHRVNEMNLYWQIAIQLA
jgi:hypothetical protein